ncbi:tricarballylate utilization protein TcuB [Burkholderia sp. WAC0059]|uniref:tricarballylate utilization 4Fe-4S protein TcuB n=1 Tax=Burkholderia sp. WAC0059 TaxID=2066022 RepID=UPI000C7F5FF2|nr:tricarballylate utilization 4Fe-4S protein TcuB [Burkholderia sp. WAC0059]PLZ02653.1 tricarballylate utilization protein TcuB [Burkholderia sp. WAC0059]
MQALETLIEQAGEWTGTPVTNAASPLLPVPEDEASRILQICNACRYCEGFCAVFPAMTRRLEFGAADVHYLANLCHNCGACLHACQYAPPHEFAVNVPQTMASVRGRTYRLYAWPRAFAALYERNGLVLALALAAGIALFLIMALALRGNLWQAAAGGAFYDVFPHGLMAGIFAPVFVFALGVLGVDLRRFWREADPGPASGAALAEAGGAVATLRYLGGGHGEGCNNDSDRFSLARRHCHHATAYGFLLCFLSTCVATLYHYAFRLEAPYAYTSVPALLGTAGGIGIALGTLGLGWLNLRRHPLQGDLAQKPMDLGFIALLLVVAVSGLALMALRTTAAMPILLALHLGAVIALFLTLPYGKFAHGPLRAAALLKWAIERRQPNRLGLAED